VKKTDTSAAYYEIVESEAEVVRLIFDAYTRQGLSLGAIAGLLNQREVPTRTRHSRWERPTLWRMLHNPALTLTADRADERENNPAARRNSMLHLNESGTCCRLYSRVSPTRKIAARIGVSEGSVKSTLQQLFSKTGVRTRSQLLRIVLEQHRDQV
jgi:DNA-binding CsgD family transcriptional regulator